jgi:hypothetical protein
MKFHYSALGLIQDEHRQGLAKGWSYMLDHIRARAEGGHSR